MVWLLAGAGLDSMLHGMPLPICGRRSPTLEPRLSCTRRVEPNRISRPPAVPGRFGRLALRNTARDDPTAPIPPLRSSQRPWSTTKRLRSDITAIRRWWASYLSLSGCALQSRPQQPRNLPESATLYIYRDMIYQLRVAQHRGLSRKSPRGRSF